VTAWGIEQNNIYLTTTFNSTINPINQSVKMAMRVGQLIQGARAKYQLLQPLKANTVFKAQIIDSLDLNRNWYVY
jgi:hypothetical protein